jgi:hypothetical protein
MNFVATPMTSHTTEGHSGQPSPFSSSAQHHQPVLGEEGSEIAATERKVTENLPHLLRLTIPVRQSLACGTPAMYNGVLAALHAVDPSV